MQESDTYHSPVARPAGVFYLNSWLNMSSILDGTSNTALVSEIRLLADNKDFRGVLHYPEGPLYHHDHTPNSLVPDEIRSQFCVDDRWSPCIGTFSAWIPRYLTMTARSYHPGGVHLLLGDGHVRFVSESIALDVWQAVGTPMALPGEPAAFSL
jgi:prepilin-type processing-associated H-X9-DG protein